MPQERRKVLLYLRPEISSSERFADAKIESHPRSDRGDMARTALLAGIALGEVDNRLPSMLSALLADGITPQSIRKMLISFLEITPIIPLADTDNEANSVTKTSEIVSMSAKNLAVSLPD